jgi:hypothetical protein
MAAMTVARRLITVFVIILFDPLVDGALRVKLQAGLDDGAKASLFDGRCGIILADVMGRGMGAASSHPWSKSPYSIQRSADRAPRRSFKS